MLGFEGVLSIVNELVESSVSVLLVPNNCDDTEDHEDGRGHEAKDETDLVDALELFGGAVRLGGKVKDVSVGLGARVSLVSIVVRLESDIKGTAAKGRFGVGQGAHGSTHCKHCSSRHSHEDLQFILIYSS